MAKPSTSETERPFLEQLSGKQRQAFERLRDLLTARDRDLGQLHDIARCVKVLHQLNPGESSYGQYRIRRLHEALAASGCPCSRTLLFRALKVAKFKKKEIKALPDHVTQGHLLEVVDVTDDKDLRWLLQQVKDEGWPLRKLRREKYKLNYRAARGGRKRSPEDYGHAVSLRELCRLARKWQEQYDCFWKKPEGPHRKALRQQVRTAPSAEQRDEVKEAATLFKALTAAAKDLAAELHDLSARSDERPRTRHYTP
jgi:hypothetical protein